jgi:osmotically-inducible protein OsmY
MKSNAELERDVLDELLWDPSINAANIHVAVDHGSVTLSGSIASYTESSPHTSKCLETQQG